MNSYTSVSIITVVYNGAKTIEQTIKSVIDQTYKNIEYIIIDGGSTDGTLDIIKKYETAIAHLVSEPDKGLYDAMNKGIQKASGELIGMINSDDWYEPNAVELVVNAYNKNPEKKIFHGDRYDILEDGSKRIRKYNSSILKFIYYGMTYNHPSMFVHKSKYKDIVYDITLQGLSDYEFVLNNYLKNSEIFLYIPEPYVNYRLEGISANMNGRDALIEGYKARRKAGLNSIINILSFVFRVCVVVKKKY